jgi:uncharacterized membrane protein/osmotically-inducible protein OsmY
MKQRHVLLTGLGLGAGLMYFFEPDRGRRRRAHIRDAATHIVNAADDVIGKAVRDLRHRASGFVAEIDSAFRSEDVIDDVLVARVRSKLGRVVSHPHAVEVTADQGRVTLRGHVLSSEEDSLLKAVSRVRGVREVENKLKAHEEAGHIPELQGGVPRDGETFELLQANWSPAVRLLAGAAGGALALYGARRKGAVGATVEMAGLGLLARGLTNLEMRDVLGLRGGRGISVQKTININASVERVFNIWNQHECFPFFMSRVREVKALGNDRFHWTVAGPAGIPVEWEAVITERIPNRKLVFESMAGSAIEQKGVVRFQPNKRRGTRVDVKMSYHPPAGVVGHIVARLFGADPRSEMIEDMMRMKSFIETQHQPHDAIERQAGGRHRR